MSESVKDQGALSRPDLKLEKLILSAHRLFAALADTHFLDKRGITLGEWAILCVLEEQQAHPLVTLARRAGMAPGQVKKIVRDLQSKGLAVPGKPESGDGGAPAFASSARAAPLRAAVLADLQVIAEKMAEPVPVSVPSAVDAEGLGKVAQRVVIAARVTGQVVRAMRQARPPK